MTEIAALAHADAPSSFAIDRAPRTHRANVGGEDTRRLVDNLRRELRGHGPVRLIETHISFVLLTGERAYKIKKAVDLGFLDFSTIEARRFYCEEEVRLNRRLAPEIYRRVVAITGPADAPQIQGQGPVLDYAVEMAQFDDRGLLAAELERGELTPDRIDALVGVIARFHGEVARAAASSEHGRPGRVLERAMENVASLRTFLADTRDRDRLYALDRWIRREHTARRNILEARHAAGFVRECHGDLHLGNIVLIGEAVVPFDCIEFSEDLRWIDVMSEIAFTIMDLQARGHSQLAHRLLNGYLEITGDYAGLAVLRFYLVYRAMVRAKIAAIRASQLSDGRASTSAQRECSHYLRLALHYTFAAHAAVIITHGVSGTGKTTLTQSLLERIGAVRIRSDVERKRMHGVARQARTASALGGGIYAAGSNVATYEVLRELASCVVDNGYPVLVDATFLKRWQRAACAELAARRHVPYVILTFEAPLEVLRERVVRRAREARDASEATAEVLDAQLRTQERLTADEQPREVIIDASTTLEGASARAMWQPVIRALHRHGTPVTPPAVEQAMPLESKLEFLGRPENYGTGTARVAAVETHLSWVFLTDRDAYKLKKPICTAHADLRSILARGQNSSEEVTLNRRLTTDVYLGVVALTSEGDGALGLDGAGPVVDWLVHMRRLPSGRMLDRLILACAIQPADMMPVVERLCELYRRAARATLSATEYRARWVSEIEVNRRELARFPMQLAPVRVAELAQCQLDLVDRHAAALCARAREGRIVEGHGDLRPEHICLESPPQIIDALEFSRELRMLDPIDELGFLALECTRLGAPSLQPAIFDAYVRSTHDVVDPQLVAFYQSHRAMVRARLAITHLDDDALRDTARWEEQARAYLELALGYGTIHV